MVGRGKLTESVNLWDKDDMYGITLCGDGLYKCRRKSTDSGTIRWRITGFDCIKDSASFISSHHAQLTMGWVHFLSIISCINIIIYSIITLFSTRGITRGITLGITRSLIMSGWIRLNQRPARLLAALQLTIFRCLQHSRDSSSNPNLWLIDSSLVRNLLSRILKYCKERARPCQQTLSSTGQILEICI